MEGKAQTLMEKDVGPIDGLLRVASCPWGRMGMAMSVWCALCVSIIPMLKSEGGKEKRKSLMTLKEIDVWNMVLPECLLKLRDY